VGRYPYVDQPGDQSRKGEYKKSCQTETVRYKRNTEGFFLEIIAKQNQAVTRLTEPFRLEMKKPIGFVALDRLRVNVQEHASAYRSSRASHLRPFEQPANKVFRHPAR
jgi:hypothetical protein